MKPNKPFMIEKGNDLAVVYRSITSGYQHVDWVGWDGTKFATREDAEKAIRNCGYTDAQVIEILDEQRVVIPARDRA